MYLSSLKMLYHTVMPCKILLTKILSFLNYRVHSLLYWKPGLTIMHCPLSWVNCPPVFHPIHPFFKQTSTPPLSYTYNSLSILHRLTAPELLPPSHFRVYLVLIRFLYSIVTGGVSWNNLLCLNSRSVVRKWQKMLEWIDETTSKSLSS